jgi:glycosyltransferase involved in cell wall biosynthesis
LSHSANGEFPKTKVNEDLPLVAIGVPVYNGGKYLEECLSSILNQTYNNWECVIVDNFSDDDTNQIARSFVEKDKRFKLFRNDRLLPVMENWNMVFSYVSKDAEYFKIVPADDWLFETFLEEFVELMENYPSVGVCSSYRIDGIRIRGNGLDYYEGNVFNGRTIIKNELFLNLDVSGSGNAVLYRVDELKKLESFPAIFSLESLHGDTDLTYNILYHSDLGFIFKVLSYTRRHQSSITSEVASKLYTSICFRDNQMVKYKSIIDDFQRRYQYHRMSYALLYFKNLIRFNRKAINWHNQNLHNRIKNREIFRALLLNYTVYKFKGQKRN